jgi:uncharacterized repeat protein (TIGR03803 family)
MYAATLAPLWQFSGGYDGAEPEAGLVQASNSNFYGTTYSGGTNNWGTVFTISPTGTLKTVYFFTGYTALNDGGNPSAGLVQGFDGNLYGTTYSGGSNGVGTVFRVTSQGTLTTLWQFSAGPEFTGGPGGGEPMAGLVQGIESNFYGTTYAGGTTSCWCGTVFKITPQGTLTTLWQFTGGGDGSEPEAGLVQGSDGNFYGTTSYGGKHDYGTVFRITPAGALTNLWEFTGGSDGASPWAGLVLGSDGDFYGSTPEGGSGHGTVFRITPAGVLSTLWQFTGGSDGSAPVAGLIQASDELFYGTTSAGGANGLGNVFRISSIGVFTNLYSFMGQPDGSDPGAALVQGFNGNFYGTTYSGGSTNNAGVVFELSGASSGGCSSNFVPEITAIQMAADDVVVTLPTIQCQSYQLQFSTSLVPTNWVDVAGALQVGTGSPVMLTNAGGALEPHGFYRVGISAGGGSGSIQTLAQIDSIQEVGTNIVVTVTAVAADTYQLQYSNTIVSPMWMNTGGPTNGVTGTLQLIDYGAALLPQRYYQILETVPEW